MMTEQTSSVFPNWHTEPDTSAVNGRINGVERLDREAGFQPWFDVQIRVEPENSDEYPVFKVGEPVIVLWGRAIEPDTSVESLQQPSPYLVVPSVATNKVQASEVLIALTATQVAEIEGALKELDRLNAWIGFEHIRQESAEKVARIRRALKGG